MIGVGCVAVVGVIGLTLGDAPFLISRFCDNIETSEIVLAFGEVLNGNKRAFPNLYKALIGNRTTSGWPDAPI